MVLKNFLAKLGHGGAKVDLILDKQEYVLDEQVSGELVIQGGTVEQHINKIDIELVMSLYYKNHHYTQTVQVFPFHTPFNIQPSEKKVFPFSCKIPSNLLLSSHSVSYYFITHLDIAGAVDHTDRDYVKILPPARLQNLLKAFEQIGFYEKHDSRSFTGYAQEFELKPTGPFKDQIEEVEFIVSLEESGIRLLLEVDLYSFLGEKEIKREVWFENTVLDNHSQLVERLQEILNEMVNNPHEYAFNPSHHDHGHKLHKHIGFGTAAGLVGGIAAGIVAAKVMDEVVDEVEDWFEGDQDDENEISFDEDDD